MNLVSRLLVLVRKMAMLRILVMMVMMINDDVDDQAFCDDDGAVTSLVTK